MHALARGFCVAVAIVTLSARLIAAQSSPSTAGTLGTDAGYQIFADHVVISGGSGNNHWEMKYGFPPSLVDSQYGPPIAFGSDGKQLIYFSNGQWLRVIDAKSGTVMQRWAFGKMIRKIESLPNTQKVVLTLDDSNAHSPDAYSTKLTLDMDSPAIPAWGVERLLLTIIAAQEPFSHTRSISASVDYQRPSPCEPAKAALPELEEMIHRDPLSPWFRFLRAKVFQDCKDAHAHAAFEDVFQVAHPDFHDFFRLARDFDDAGEPELSAKAFEIGYTDFVRKGFEPRMLYPLIARLMLYPYPSLAATERAKTGGWSPQQAADAERLYRIAPNVEWSSLAWNAFASHVPPDQVALWKQRTADARNAGLLEETSFLRPLDVALYIIFGGGLAVYLYIAIVYIRLWPRLGARAKTLATTPRWKKFSWFGLPYWSAAQRAGFVLLVALIWIAGGVATVGAKVLMRVAGAPVSMFSGSLADPASRAYLDKLDASDAHDLVKAIALEQNSDDQGAEALYRSLPQFAESWNNLGVLLAKAGRKTEAQSAFATSLRLDPSLSEAAINLGNPAPDFWTQQYRKMTSSPMPAPPRGSLVRRAFSDSRRAMLVTILKGPDPMVEQGFDDQVLSITIQRILIYLPPCIVLFFLLSRPKPLPDVPPTRLQTVIDFLVPGISPGWKWLSATVFGAWICLLLLLLNHGTLILESLAIPNIQRAFGLPEAWMITPQLDAIRLHTLPLYGIAAALFLVNFVVVFLGSTRTQSSAHGLNKR